MTDRTHIKRETLNGIERPSFPKVGDALCFEAWAMFYELAYRNGCEPSHEDAQLEGEARGLNGGNVRTELSRWRRFHGVTGS